MKSRNLTILAVLAILMLMVSLILVPSSIVQAQSLSLSPPSGAPGTGITITGSGFTAGATGWVWFDSDGDSVRDAAEPQVSVTATGGAIPGGTTLSVPSVAAGTYFVRADIPTGAPIEASASFTVLPAPSITLAPASGAPGTGITITGSGFAGGATGVVWFDSNGNNAIDGGEPQVPVTTTAAGAIPAGTTLAVPSVAPGIYSVRADIPTGLTVEASASFTVPAPGITLSSTSGAPGTVITITGSGFTPNTAGVVGFDIDGNGAIDLGEPQMSVTTTAAGAIPAGTTLTIPSVAPGTYQVRADIPAGLPIEASASFTVLPIPSISLSSTSGTAGTVITITGSGFTPNISGVVWFDFDGDNTIDVGEPQASVTTTSAGAIPSGITLTVPSVVPGTYAVRADIPTVPPDIIEASVNFTVSTPSISLSPSIGVSGTIIVITGSSFALNTAGVVWFDSNGNNAIDAPGEPQVSVTTTTAGAIPAGTTLTVPNVAPGTYQVRADIPAGAPIDASATFTVPTPGISLSPASGAPGTVITITVPSGSSFAPNTAGWVWFDSDGDSVIDGGEPQVSVTTTTAGAIPAGTTLTIPNVEPGIYLVRADIPAGLPIEASATFSVPTPTVVVTPTSGVPGTVITITGSGFALNTAGVVGFDSDGNGAIDPTEPQVSVTTTSAGAVPSGITLTVPSVAPGTYLVRADIPDGGTVEASASFTVPSPSVTLTPTLGVAGTVITISGSGFALNTAGVVGFDSDGNGAIDASEPQASVTTTSAGAVPSGITLTVPSVAPGTYLVRADVPSGESVEASATFTVPTPSITLSPASGIPGTVITISGSGFALNTSGWVWFDSNRDSVVDPGEPQVSVTTTSAGAIPGGTTLTVPTVTVGSYRVLADIPTGGAIEDSAGFTVSTMAISLSPTSGAPGTVITISGSGFTPNIAGWVWFDSNGDSVRDPGERQVPVTTTAVGAIPGGTILTVLTVVPTTYQVLADIPAGAPVEASASFTVLTPAISLSPSSGAPGTVTTISGSGFAPNIAGWVWFDSNRDSVRDAAEPQASVTTTSAGAVPSGITLTVPVVTPGTYSVQADIPDGGTVEASASFTVPTPNISLSLTSGGVGTVTTISGSGLTPNIAGWVWFDSNGDSVRDAAEPQASVTTTSTGAVPSGITLTVPVVTPGTYSVQADIPDGGTVEASASFTVLVVAVALSPASGVAGTVTTITGSGFAVNTAGWVWFDSNGDSVRDPGEPQVSVTSSASGFIPSGVTLSIPAVPLGTYQVRADIPGGGTVEASASFTLTQPPEQAVSLSSAIGDIILASGDSVEVLSPDTLPFMGTIGIQSTGLRYDVDIWTGTSWNTIVEAGARNASYPVSGLGLRITNDTTTDMTVSYMLVYLR